ncbi:MAG: MmgE/PrpD family protein [Alphaproteobacteria bacterium]|nr:MmgE/PrpD family protein [Alphaproteobacteria bacterium]
MARQLARWAVGVRLDDVPPDVRHVARRSILDTVGVTLVGRSHGTLARLRSVAARLYPMPAGDRMRGRVSAAGAALVNATAAHVYDFDDTSYTGVMHGSAPVLPAALAVAQDRDIDGRRLLEAFVAGVEVTYAVALAAQARLYSKGWWSTGTFAVLGATVAAGKLLDVDAERMTAAIGLAAAQANGAKSIFGTDGKAYLCGRTAQAGVEIAHAAAGGLTGPADAFESARGFFALLNDGMCDPGAVDALGTVWRQVDPGIMFKSYPICSAAHAAAELAPRLLVRARRTAVQVAQVIVDVPPLVALSLVHADPRTAQEAQFSAPFAVACALMHGSIGPEHLAAPVIADPALRALMAKVEMRVDQALAAGDLARRCPEGSRVTLRFADGGEASAYLGSFAGMPDNPLDDQAIEAKFRHCVCLSEAGADASRANRLSDALWRIESERPREILPELMTA